MTKAIALTDLTAEDWQAAEELAALLGVPSGELVGDLIEGLNGLSPPERADFERLVDEASAVLPQMNATLDRIGERIASCRSMVRDMDESIRSTMERVSGIEGAMGLVTAP